jgi:predicted signal transduction protein with EAL and GGDEF domain
MINLDHFQRINDTLGINIGDELLREVARRLSDCSYDEERNLEATLWRFPVAEGSGDLVAHLGGDEFVVILPNLCDIEDAAMVARRISANLARPMSLRNNDFCITASIGISVYPDDGHDAEDMLKQCGAALNCAKNDGRNCYRFYKSSMNARAYERLVMEAKLRQALDLQQFRIYYQPRVSADGENVLGMEALIRWAHPDLGMIPPAEFIPIAEETGLIILIGQWILAEVCRQVVEWRTMGLPALRVSVNLSPVQFKHESLHRNLTEILAKSGLEPRFLELEITESLLMHDVESTITLLHKLKAVGLSISIDDFGTGYSSLSYLKRFPISTLKIDQSFVRDLKNDPDDVAIVQAIIALAHSLRLQVVAEGVEQKSQMNILRELGCDEVQGYYFSRALPPEAFAAWVQARSPFAKLQALG